MKSRDSVDTDISEHLTTFSDAVVLGGLVSVLGTSGACIRHRNTVYMCHCTAAAFARPT